MSPPSTVRQLYPQYNSGMRIRELEDIPEPTAADLAEMEDLDLDDFDLELEDFDFDDDDHELF